MLAISYCTECRESMNSYGEICNDLFDEICEEYICTNDCLELCTSPKGKFYFLVNIIKFLEIKNHVISSESGIDFIKVKPLGINSVLDGQCLTYHICFDRE